jgi:hypothetical protein
MFASEDVYSTYRHCLQCGFSKETTELGSLDEELEAVLRPHREKLGLAAVRSTVR